MAIIVKAKDKGRVIYTVVNFEFTCTWCMCTDLKRGLDTHPTLLHLRISTSTIYIFFYLLLNFGVGFLLGGVTWRGNGNDSAPGMHVNSQLTI